MVERSHRCRVHAEMGNFVEAPGFSVVNLVANLKDQISHAEFTAHEIPPVLLWRVLLLHCTPPPPPAHQGWQKARWRPQPTFGQRD